jgi:hypothetical protein
MRLDARVVVCRVRSPHCRIRWGRRYPSCLEAAARLRTVRFLAALPLVLHTGSQEAGREGPVECSIQREEAASESDSGLFPLARNDIDAALSIPVAVRILRCGHRDRARAFAWSDSRIRTPRLLRRHAGATAGGDRADARALGGVRGSAGERGGRRRRSRLSRRAPAGHGGAGSVNSMTDSGRARLSPLSSTSTRCCSVCTSWQTSTSGPTS